jgi:hypothetical protein
MTLQIDLLNFQGGVNWNIFRAPARGAAAVVDLHFVPLVRNSSICGNSSRGLLNRVFCLNFRSQKFLTSHIWDGIGQLPLKNYPPDLNEYSSHFASMVMFDAGWKLAGDEEQQDGFWPHILLSINKTNEGRCKTSSPSRTP